MQLPDLTKGHLSHPCQSLEVEIESIELNGFADLDPQEVGEHLRTRLRQHLQTQAFTAQLERPSTIAQIQAASNGLSATDDAESVANLIAEAIIRTLQGEYRV
jgi:hypothetical protein